MLKDELKTILENRSGNNFDAALQRLKNELGRALNDNSYKLEINGGQNNTPCITMTRNDCATTKTYSSVSLSMSLIFKKIKGNKRDGAYLDIYLATVSNSAYNNKRIPITKKIIENCKNNNIFNNKPIIKLENKSDNSYASRHEHGCIYAKEFTDKELTSLTEAQLKTEIDALKTIYEQIIINEGITPINTFDQYFENYVKTTEPNTKKSASSSSSSGSANAGGTSTSSTSSSTTTKNNERNRLYYGIPGSGKSYKADEEAKAITTVALAPSNLYRVTFYEDYSYSDFIGQILPDSSSGSLKYDFKPGIFTKALTKAFENPEENVVLIVEEINRGNAPSIFGDIFQSLDRDINYESNYKIDNEDILNEVNKHLTTKIKEVKLPANFYIFATMNTSDQNVFTLDTAFKRRWSQEFIDDQDTGKFTGKIIHNLDYDVNADQNYDPIDWDKFHIIIDKLITNLLQDSYNAEDKGIGYYFLKDGDFNTAKSFGEKIFQYLWFDVFNLKKAEVFNFKTYRELIRAFTTKTLHLFGNSTDSIFKEELRKLI